MKFNLSNIVKIANSISNPKEGINLLLNEFAKKDPKRAKTLSMYYNSGKSPAEVLTAAAANGEISLNELNELKNNYKFAKRLGLKINVPKKAFEEAETIIKNATNKSTGNDGFRGF